MMSVDGPEFNRFANDQILREWDALSANVGCPSGDSNESHDPKIRPVALECSTQSRFGSLRGFTEAVLSAFASRIDLTGTGYAALPPGAFSSKASLDADRT